MDRERIKSLGSDPLNGNDAYAVLGIVFDWIENQNGPLPSHEELEEELRKAGYSFERDS
jgi:hypothetical protein